MRIGKCKEKNCNGELFLIGKNYFSDWRQEKCKKCGKVYGVSYSKYLALSHLKNIIKKGDK